MSLELERVIRGHRFGYQSEYDLQLGISVALEDCGIQYEREVRLSDADRIDFLVGTVGIEVKVDGATSAVIRQLHRYLQSPRVSAVMLITNRARHRMLAGEMCGKPVYVVFIAEAF